MVWELEKKVGVGIGEKGRSGNWGIKVGLGIGDKGRNLLTIKHL